jgi:hypothetical protein
VRRVSAWAALAVAAACLATGCSSTSTHASASSSPSVSCGNTRTGANVPVIIQVAKGNVDCSTAMAVEQDYATAIKKGELKGNGGGAPLTVDGWTCQGYPTPKVLSTGDASECHTGNSEILAELDVPASGATTSS